ncbi:MAG: nicotinate-nucleotide--dimethylbenzimidazole phosphoribosyltransferase, partial [Leclercia adecarboxylata]|nr:nicotinate-nucleotide--dimethylbenzimidazole phosphoribosyltransferase [Leclercia adecarboxylata]
MQTIQDLLAAIAPLDKNKQKQAAQHIDGLVKPLNSLGRLETLAIQLAGMGGLTRLDDLQKEIVVMCADHGVYEEGVAISPQQVTCEPIETMLSLKVGRGSGNIARGPAMSRDDAEQLLLRSARLVQQRAAEGIAVFGTGELGIANTTPASAIISVLSGCDPQEVVGIGANLPADRIQHKEAIVRQAIAVNQPDPGDAIDVLAKVGGYDLVGMTGVILGAGACGLPVVLDGFLSYAAAMAACQLAPEVKNY